LGSKTRVSAEPPQPLTRCLAAGDVEEEEEVTFYVMMRQRNLDQLEESLRRGTRRP
jgi:hypothetical protein